MASIGSRRSPTHSEAGTGFGGIAEDELNQLEEVVLAKIQQRVPSNAGEENFIVKSFKYHDLTECGAVDFMKFRRAMAPFTAGILDPDVRLIFDRYAPDGSLRYKPFATEFVRGTRRRLALKSRNGLVPSTPTGSVLAAQQQWERPEDCLARMKRSLLSRGPRAVIALAMSFREADPENSRTVNQMSFDYVLSQHFSHDTGCFVQAAQAAHLFQLFVQPYTPGLIAYDEFMLALKDEPMSQERRAAVRAAFRRLDQTSQGLVDINKVFKAYNVSRHPQVSDGSRLAEEVYNEFLETLQDSIAFRRGQRCYPSSMVAWEEFEDYWKFVSGCIDTDAMFCGILQRVFDLDKVPNQSVEDREVLARPAAGIPGKSRTGLHHWQKDTLPAHVARGDQAERSSSIMQVLERARAAIAKKGLRAAVDVVQHFYSADDDVDDLLDMYEFRRACQQSGILMNEADEDACLRMCGEGEGRQRKISLVKFLRALHGPVSPPRYTLIERVFRSLGGDPTNEESQVNPQVLKDAFSADKNPLVMKGELDPGMVLGEFLDTFSLLAHVYGSCQNGMVSFTDLLAYYDLVSSTIDSDALFELLLSRLWLSPRQDGEEAMLTTGGFGSPTPRGAASRAGDSPSRRWAVPVYQAPENPMSEKRPPPADGPGTYGRGIPVEEGGETHRRFGRGSGAGSGPAPITKSHIVFNDVSSQGELGAVLERLRSSIARRGLKGWRLLGERFQQQDHRRNGSCMRLDWQRLHRSLGLGLSPDEQELVFKSFCVTRRDGAMDYNECLRHMRGPLSDRRAGLVQLLFDHLSEQGPFVSAETLTNSFDPKSSPLCLVGGRDPMEEHQEFLEAVEHFGPQGFDGQGFADFFTLVSTIYREEDEFKLVTTTAFGLRTGGPTFGGC